MTTEGFLAGVYISFLVACCVVAIIHDSMEVALGVAAVITFIALMREVDK